MKLIVFTILCVGGFTSLYYMAQLKIGREHCIEYGYDEVRCENYLDALGKGFMK